MKRFVGIHLINQIKESNKEIRRQRHVYEGVWYQRKLEDYLLYCDEGIHTTLRWNCHELRLYRRGDRLESHQLFRKDLLCDFELKLAGNTISLTALTHHLTTTTEACGGEIAIIYALRSGMTALGEFTLSIAWKIIKSSGDSSCSKKPSPFD